jgi:hypothetical protein
MPDIATDFVILGATAGGGLAIGLLHDLWLVLALGYEPRARRRARYSRLRASYLAPVWVVSIAMAWGVLILVSAGTVRGFAFIGFACGLLLYYVLLSRLVRTALLWAKRAVAAVLRTALDALTWAALLPWRVACWFGRPIVAVLTATFAVPAGWLSALLAWAGRLLSRVAGRIAERVKGLCERHRPGPPPAEPE